MAKIMLVEDDNNLRNIYKTRLQAEGYTIVPAADGEEALVLAQADKPDLIIADIMMPKVSGFELLDILRNTDKLKDIRIIMLTALGQSEDEQKAKSLGADRYFVKTQVTLEDIVKAAKELLSEQPA
jgi:DNA-binding response OmpR family regulator